MNTGPDSHDEDDEVPDASELLDFELIAKSEPDRGRGLWLWVVLIIVLAGGGWAGWMYLQGDTDDVAGAEGVPLILSPKFELKQRPSDPGGMAVPDRDKLVYDRMAGEDGEKTPGVERLLPPPESPIEPPRAVENAGENAGENATEAESAGEAAAEAAQPSPETVPDPVPVEPAPTPAEPAPPPPPGPTAETQAAATPAPEPEPAPAPEPSVKFQATAPAGQGYLVQMSAVRTEQAARGEWDRLAKAHPDVLGGLESVIQRADLGDKGIFYRVRAGWFTSRTEAKAVCDELSRRNVGCLIAGP